MVSGTSNKPLAIPILFLEVVTSIGTSFATGRPFLAITISRSWPSSILSTNRDKEDLACNILTVVCMMSS